MSTPAGLEAYGFTPAMRAALEARGSIAEIPARVTAVHKERYALVCDRGECYGRLKSAVYFNGGEQEFPTTGDFVLISYNELGDSIITETYGFEKNSWEAETTPRAESFWSFSDPLNAKKWLLKGGQKHESIG